MNLQTNLAGRLRNTSLPKNHGLMPVFEAVINSIQSIEEKGNIKSDGKIILKINRRSQMQFNSKKKNIEPINGFEIIDNGCGFNDVNFSAFQTLDTDHKIAKGCRGVGRLLWLKVFKNVKVISFFVDDKNKYKKRTFEFNIQKNVYNEKISDCESREIKTIITLDGFDEKYRSEVAKTLSSISKQLLEHCLWYFVRSEGVPDIIIQDEDEELILHKLYKEYMHEDAYTEAINILDHQFDLIHIKFRALTNKKHLLSFCAASRLVKEETITEKKIPGLFNEIKDDKGPFIYTCYIASSFLDEHVRSERTSFDIPENVGGLFSNSKISFDLIEKKVLERTKEYLSDSLKENINAGRERLLTFVDKKSPEYKSLLRYVPEDKLSVPPQTDDKDLEKYIRDLTHDVSEQIIDEGKKNMALKEGESIENYENRLKDYFIKIGEVNQADLTKYVIHRRVVIDYFKHLTELKENGKYVNENFIHQLIMPLRRDSTEVLSNSCNLWLLDERLAFHNFLSSDKPIKSMPITDSDSMKRPDLCCLQLSDNPLLVNDGSALSLASITIVEFKKPMRGDVKGNKDKDPIQQCYDYLENIRLGKVKTRNGRPIPKQENIPAFCYIIADLTPNMIQRCNGANLTPTSDNMGFFGYNSNYKAYIEVMSFDRLLYAAIERNQVFFDKLGIHIF